MDRKSFDNFLLRIGSEAIPAGRQGVERRIALGLLEELFLAKELNATLGVPAREAFTVVRQLLGRTADGTEMSMGGEFVGSVRIGSYVQLGADLSSLRSELRRRYESAVETVVRPQRGRPRKRATLPQASSDA
jgi:hypothetical protein